MTANLTGLWRYRVGDYRLICDIQDGELVVLVLQVAHRSQAYRWAVGCWRCRREFIPSCCQRETPTATTPRSAALQAALCLPRRSGLRPCEHRWYACTIA